MGRRWTPEEIEQLKVEFDKGTPLIEIVEKKKRPPRTVVLEIKKFLKQDPENLELKKKVKNYKSQLYQLNKDEIKEYGTKFQHQESMQGLFGEFPGAEFLDVGYEIFDVELTKDFKLRVTLAEDDIDMKTAAADFKKAAISCNSYLKLDSGYEGKTVVLKPHFQEQGLPSSFGYSCSERFLKAWKYGLDSKVKKSS